MSVRRSHTHRHTREALLMCRVVTLREFGRLGQLRTGSSRGISSRNPRPRSHPISNYIAFGRQVLTKIYIKFYGRLRVSTTPKTGRRRREISDLIKKNTSRGSRDAIREISFVLAMSKSRRGRVQSAASSKTSHLTATR